MQPLAGLVDDVVLVASLPANTNARMALGSGISDTRAEALLQGIILSDFMHSLPKKYCPRHVVRVKCIFVCTKAVAHHGLAKTEKTFL